MPSEDPENKSRLHGRMGTKEYSEDQAAEHTLRPPGLFEEENNTRPETELGEPDSFAYSEPSGYPSGPESPVYSEYPKSPEYSEYPKYPERPEYPEYPVAPGYPETIPENRAGKAWIIASAVTAAVLLSVLGFFVIRKIVTQKRADVTVQYIDQQVTPDYTTEGSVKWSDSYYTEVPAEQESTKQVVTEPVGTELASTEPAGTVQPAVADGKYTYSLCRPVPSRNEVTVYYRTYVNPSFDFWGGELEWHNAQYCYEHGISNIFMVYNQYDTFLDGYRYYEYYVTDIQKEGDGYRFYYMYYDYDYNNGVGEVHSSSFFINDSRECLSAYRMASLPVAPNCRYLSVDYEGTELSKEEFWNNYYTAHYGDFSYVDVTVSGGVIVEMQISFFE